ncbi:MAG: NAD(P)-binding protein [Pseudomonadota bacterium]
MPKTKIAVLGGGIGSLSALLQLTQDPAVREGYEITLYQLGWRLGGKCASGRDVSHPPAARVYEHGLHIFAGFYYYAFNMLKDCYATLDGAGGVPGRDVYDAFRPKNKVVLYERVDGKQIPWPIEFLAMPGAPSDPPVVPTVPEYIESLIEAIFLHLIGGDGRHASVSEQAPLASIESAPKGIAERLRDAAEALGTSVVHRLFDPKAPVPDEPHAQAHHRLHQALLLARHGAQGTSVEDGHQPAIVTLLDHAANDLKAASKVFGSSDWFRRLTRGVNLARAVVAGFYGDQVATRGFDPLDDEELKDWLRRWGAWEETVEWAPVDAGYDYAFAYCEGDEARPSLGAGTGLRGFMRLLFAYKGALFWEMEGAMGETVILPMYQVLRQRGVQFRFFHQITDLALSEDGQAVERITICRQAEVKPGGDPQLGGYDPLIDIGEAGLKAWPSEPLWDSLVNGDALRGIDFESPWSPNPDATEMHLSRGTDFDQVICGISVAELARVSGGLSAASPRWKQMVEGIQVSRTVGLQMWTRFAVGEDGGGDGGAGGGFAWPDRVSTRTDQPLSTWSDMTFLLSREFWPPEDPPKGLYYFCGQIAGAAEPPDFSDPTAPERALDEAREESKRWLRDNTAMIMPNKAVPGTPLGLDPAGLFVDDGSTGEARFDWQYTRVNMAPTELYVQSAPGTFSNRLRANESGFENLWLAGDWTRNGINAGCVEATVMSGIQCANAMLGDPSPIDGERDV